MPYVCLGNMKVHIDFSFFAKRMALNGVNITYCCTMKVCHSQMNVCHVAFKSRYFKNWGRCQGIVLLSFQPS